MARSDQGYTKARQGSSRISGGRSRAFSTYAAEARKDELVAFYLDHKLRGILDVLGDVDDETRMAIREGMTEEYNESTMTKAEIESAVYKDSRENGAQALLGNERKIRMVHEADALVAALESATRSHELENLDEGEWLDDPVGLLTDGSGWGEERLGARGYEKHVNIAVDNSGSTHMPVTGYCAAAMEDVANNLMEVLFVAASKWPGVTWDAYSYNRIAHVHTGSRGQRRRLAMVRQAMQRMVVENPRRTDAVQTNLAPLIESMYDTEVRRNLIGSPRLDIILTDGEFESQKDADAAAEWQRKRGAGVTTYVLNLCPETPSDVTLPHQFRVIPLRCVTGSELRKEVDGEGLRQALMQVVLSEVGK